MGMDNQGWVMEAEKNMDKMIMLSFGLLYVGVCPAATILVFIYFAINNALTLYEDLFCFLRPIVNHRPTTSGFTELLEGMVIALVILNTFMLYTLSPSFRELIE